MSKIRLTAVPGVASSTPVRYDPVDMLNTCADPGTFAGGGPRPALSMFFYLNLFYSFTVVYQCFISMKIIIFQGCRGGPTFSRGGGGPTFPMGGLNANLYRNPFPGGGGYPPSRSAHEIINSMCKHYDLLAHLSSSVRQHFQTSSSLKPLGQLNSNFMWRLLRMRERKFVQMVLVT